MARADDPPRETDVDGQQQILKSLWRPHPGQRAVLETPVRFRLVAAGRRWGKSEMCAHLALEHALENADSAVWWVAPSYQQANDFGFDNVTPLLSPDVVADTKRTEPCTIDLVNGSTLSFRSADREDSLRGGGVDLLVIDEAGSVPERAWTEELRPTLSDTLGDMVAIGTPRGRNWFYRWHQRGQSADHPDVASWQAPTEQNPHVEDSEVESARGDMPDRAFNQEYLAEFVDNAGGVFTDVRDRVAEYDLPVPPLSADANNAEVAASTQSNAPDARAQGPYAIGVDFARTEDWTVVIALDDGGRVVSFDRLQGPSWTRIQQVIERVADRYAPNTAAVDATRDNKIVQDLEDAGVSVLPVTFSASTKKTLIENLITQLETGDLVLPASESVLINELEMFEYEKTETGNVRYHAPSGMHDDCVDALSLAVHAHNQGTEDKADPFPFQ